MRSLYRPQSNVPFVLFFNALVLQLFLTIWLTAHILAETKPAKQKKESPEWTAAECAMYPFEWE